MKKVLVGMSGGVDSSVAAYLLQKEGYEVIGVTMRMWEPDCKEAAHSSCGSGVVLDARAVAERLGIRHIVIDMTKQFRQKVQQNFIDEYLHARTPNPCVQCNRHIKWEELLKEADRISADYVATGHYARILKLNNGRFTLQAASSREKDQTYALHRLTQEQLKRTRMPVGDYAKDEIRTIAAEIGLAVANKKDSMEICFIPDGDYAAFIEKNAKESLPPAGNFVLKDGTVVGQHKGLIHYTIGQRKGLNLAMGHPVFVNGIHPQTNEIVVGENEDVFSTHLVCNQLCFMGMEDLTEDRKACVKIRYAHQGSEALLSRTGADEITCTFAEPVRAVTPGQSAVFYLDDYILGGGIITHSY